MTAPTRFFSRGHMAAEARISPIAMKNYLDRHKIRPDAMGLNANDHRPWELYSEETRTRIFKLRARIRRNLP